MHYCKGIPSKLPCICIGWSPQNGSHLMTPGFVVFSSFFLKVSTSNCPTTPTKLQPSCCSLNYCFSQPLQGKNWRLRMANFEISPFSIGDTSSSGACWHYYVCSPVCTWHGLYFSLIIAKSNAHNMAEDGNSNSHHWWLRVSEWRSRTYIITYIYTSWVLPLPSNAVNGSEILHHHAWNPANKGRFTRSTG